MSPLDNWMPPDSPEVSPGNGTVSSGGLFRGTSWGDSGGAQRIPVPFMLRVESQGWSVPPAKSIINTDQREGDGKGEKDDGYGYYEFRIEEEKEEKKEKEEEEEMQDED